MRYCLPQWIALMGMASAGFAQEVASPEDDAVGNAKLAAEFADAEAGRYRFLDGEAELEAAAETVLRWSNPTGGEVYGSVVLWTRDGCPVAAASIYRFFHKEQINSELVSLAATPLTVERLGRVRWTPEGDVTWRPIPDAPEPAGTVAGRRLQARALARRFRGAISDPNSEDNLTELRLMSRPLSSYEASDDSGRDGSVFALVTSNDPEIVLLIESRESDGRRAWHYAAARMNYRRLVLRLDDDVVWQVPQAAPPWEAIRGPEGEYVILQWTTPEEAERE